MDTRVDGIRAQYTTRWALSNVEVYRCRDWKGISNLYSGTVFEGRHFTPEQVAWFMHAVLQGIPGAKIAREMQISRVTVTEVRHALQKNAEAVQILHNKKPVHW